MKLFFVTGQQGSKDILGKVFEDDVMVRVVSPIYNSILNKQTGFFARWGKTKNDDPDYSPFGPEILDIEVTTKCNGPDAISKGGGPCSFCYKANTPNGENMSFETFKTIFHKLPKGITKQIAFGADATLTSNPDIWKMFEYCRNNDYNYVVPNVTVANITPETATKLSKIVGAVAVSRYHNKDWCYNSIKHVINAGVNQCNMHIMLSQETFHQAIETIDDYHTDPRLKGLKALVFLSLKQVGRGKNNKTLSQGQFNHLISYAFAKKVPIGFDSCSSHKFSKAIQHHPNKMEMEQSIEPCESLSMSLYIDVHGKVYPCSFTEECSFECKGCLHDWYEGIDMNNVNNFIIDVWNNHKVKMFRDNNIKNNRHCVAYTI